MVVSKQILDYVYLWAIIIRKHGIQVGAGVIDPDYTGEVKVVLFNHGNVEFDIKKGDRIAQLILEKCETPPIVEIDIIEDTDRGSNGFGSSGV